jgi:YD repeat-containing protein
LSFTSLRGARGTRHFALISALTFAWSFVVATPAQLLAQGVLHPAPRLGVRLLSNNEMAKLTGRTHITAVAAFSGPAYPWEASVDGTNTANGNKLTSIPIVGWTARGGMPVALTLNHNSQSAHNSELGYKWTHSFDIFLVNSGVNETVHWGDDLSYTFTQNVDGSYSPPSSIHDSLVKNADGTFTLTRPDQTAYHFKTNLYCDTISDENSNTITIGYNAGNYVTSVTDPTSRSITLGYDTSNRINSITDPLSRQWTLAYDSSNQLTTVTLPLVNSTSYHWTMAYNPDHDISTLITPGGRSQSFFYQAADDSLATVTDGAGNVTTWTESSPTTTIADPNGHNTVYTYTSGLLTSVQDAAANTESLVCPRKTKQRPSVIP